MVEHGLKDLQTTGKIKNIFNYNELVCSTRKIVMSQVNRQNKDRQTIIRQKNRSRPDPDHGLCAGEAFTSGLTVSEKPMNLIFYKSSYRKFK